MKVITKDTIIMMLNNLFWFCLSCSNTDGTLVGYESSTDAEKNGVSVGAVEVCGCWEGDGEWINDMVSTVVFNGVSCDGDMVGDEDGKLEGKLVGVLLGLVLVEPFGIDLILHSLKS